MDSLLVELADHKPIVQGTGHLCTVCGYSYPCETRRALDRIEDLTALLDVRATNQAEAEALAVKRFDALLDVRQIVGNALTNIDTGFITDADDDLNRALVIIDGAT